MRPHFRSLGDDRRIHVVDGETAVGKFCPHCAEQHERIRALIFFGGVREMKTDIPHGCRSEQRVHDRMEQNVSVGMSEQPLLIGNIYTSYDKLSPLNKSVNIISASDSDHLLLLQARFGTLPAILRLIRQFFAHYIRISF